MVGSRLYLVTGAAGFLGGNVTRALLMGNEKVRGLVLPGDPATEGIPKEVDIFEGDILDNLALDKFFRVDRNDMEVIVIHCASIVALRPDYDQKVYDVNVQGTKNIVNKCIENKVEKLVYVSSTSAIPELGQGQSITEVESFDPDKVYGFYAKTKAEATQYVLDAVKNKGLDASVVFPSGIFGPYDISHGYVTKFTIDYVHEKIPAGVNGSFNAVDVRDLANGIIACAEKGRPGEGYILANETLSFQRLFAMIHDVSGAKEIKVFLPLSVARIAALFADFQSRITKKPPWLTSYTVYNLARNNAYSSEKAKKELGYKVRPFEETIADTIDWLKEEGMIELEIKSDNTKTRYR